MVDQNGETKFMQPTPTQLEHGFDDDHDRDQNLEINKNQACGCV